MLHRRHKIQPQPPEPELRVVVTQVRTDDGARNEQQRPEQVTATYVLPKTANRDFALGFMEGRAAAIPAAERDNTRVKLLAVTR